MHFDMIGEQVVGPAVVRAVRALVTLAVGADPVGADPLRADLVWTDLVEVLDAERIQPYWNWLSLTYFEGHQRSLGLCHLHLLYPCDRSTAHSFQGTPFILHI